MSDPSVSSRKKRRRLSASEKYEMWISVLCGQATERGGGGPAVVVVGVRPGARGVSRGAGARAVRGPLRARRSLPRRFARRLDDGCARSPTGLRASADLEAYLWRTGRSSLRLPPCTILLIFFVAVWARGISVGVQARAQPDRAAAEGLDADTDRRMIVDVGEDRDGAPRCWPTSPCQCSTSICTGRGDWAGR